MSDKPEKPAQTPEIEPLRASPVDDLTPANTIAPPEILPKLKRRPGKKVTQKQTVEILDLAARGVSLGKISATVGRNKSTISRLVKRYARIFKDLPKTDDFEQIRSQILSAVEFKALKSMSNDQKHAEATLQQSAYAFKVAHSANRLERGLSTANVELHKFAPVEVKKR